MAKLNTDDLFPRAHPRTPFISSIKIRKPEEMLAQATDIGVGGIGLRVMKALEPHTAIELELFGGRAIFLGTVRWCKPLGSGFSMGVQFSQEDSSLIAQVQALAQGRV